MCRGLICKLSLTIERVEGDWPGNWRVDSSQSQWMKCLTSRSFERKGSSLQCESAVHHGREVMVGRVKAVGKLCPLTGNRET